MKKKGFKSTLFNGVKMFREWTDIAEMYPQHTGYCLIDGIFTIYNTNGEKKYELDQYTGYWMELDIEDKPHEPPVGARAENFSRECVAHDWTLYQGFTDSYYFCKKCDRRKND